jgi:hypothetical protein
MSSKNRLRNLAKTIFLVKQKSPPSIRFTHAGEDGVTDEARVAQPGVPGEPGFGLLGLPIALGCV